MRTVPPDTRRNTSPSPDSGRGQVPRVLQVRDLVGTSHGSDPASANGSRSRRSLRGSSLRNPQHGGIRKPAYALLPKRLQFPAKQFADPRTVLPCWLLLFTATANTNRC